MALKAFITLTILTLWPVNALWPIPQEISTGNETLRITKDIQVTYNGVAVDWTMGKARHNASLGSSNSGTSSNNTTPIVRSQIVHNAIPRAMKAIFDHGLVPWMLNRPDSNWEPDLSGVNGIVTTLHITQTSNIDDANPLIGSIDESYSLSLSSSGKATIKGNSHIGVLHGLETFTQLFYKHSSGSKWYTKLAPVSIQDKPKFPYRGLMLDTGRHFYPVADIKRTIKGLSTNKMNVFHWHITEVQSWPLEIPALPKLAEAGRFAPGLSYSPDDINDVLEYGIARGVQVILEIDMPGHQMAGKAYPEVGVAYEAKPWNKYCNEPPCGALRLGNNATNTFLDTLFDDLLPRLKPYSAYFHTGGDEYKATNSLLDPDLKTDSAGVLRPLLQDFLDRVHDLIRKHGLIPIVWEEMASQWGTKVGKDVNLQAWLGASVQKYAKAGFKVIDTNYDVFYLDCGRGPWIDNARPPYRDWCPPTKPWQLIYTHDSLSRLSAAAAKNVLGGEVAIWSENIDSATLDGIAWPRTCAAAENWWSGVKDILGKVRTIAEARPRLSEMRARMIAMGLNAAAVSSLYCEQMPYGACLDD